MIFADTLIMTRYAETDQTGFVAHARIVPWLELGRAALLKQHGIVYRDLETRGYFLPVLEFGAVYHAPLRHEDEIVVRTILRSRPSFRFRLDYELRCRDEVAVTAFTVQGFVNREGRPSRPPREFLAVVDAVFGPSSARTHRPAALRETAPPL